MGPPEERIKQSCEKKEEGGDGGQRGKYKALMECATREDKTAQAKIDKMKSMSPEERKAQIQKIQKCKEDAVA